MKITTVLVLGILAGTLGCDDPGYVPEVVVVQPPLPDPVSCQRTENDLKNGIGLGVCGEDGVALTYHDDVTGYDVTCVRCSGEFNDFGASPVAAEGCFVFRNQAPIAGLCVNSCKQCGSTHDNY